MRRMWELKSLQGERGTKRCRPMFGVDSKRGTTANHAANDDGPPRPPPRSGCDISLSSRCQFTMLIVSGYIMQETLPRISSGAARATLGHISATDDDIHVFEEARPAPRCACPTAPPPEHMCRSQPISQPSDLTLDEHVPRQLTLPG
jgi:hypothetical protein